MGRVHSWFCLTGLSSCSEPPALHFSCARSLRRVLCVFRRHPDSEWLARDPIHKGGFSANLQSLCGDLFRAESQVASRPPMHSLQSLSSVLLSWHPQCHQCTLCNHSAQYYSAEHSGLPVTVCQSCASVVLRQAGREAYWNLVAQVGRTSSWVPVDTREESKPSAARPREVVRAWLHLWNRESHDDGRKWLRWRNRRRGCSSYPVDLSYTSLLALALSLRSHPPSHDSYWPCWWTDNHQFYQGSPMGITEWPFSKIRR